ncbi:MAG: O-antigen ligase family protein [Candidatus Omnitrophica bacterium]|nr:O-antigen ligase family protein [Candidatus Omnitrophota bacterium]
MTQLLSAAAVILLTGAWMLFKRLDLSPGMKLIFFFVLFLLFLRPLTSEVFFFFFQIFFQLIIFFAKNSMPLIMLPHDKYFFLFLTCFFFSFLFSVNKNASLNQLWYFLSLFAAYWVVANLPANKKIISIIYAVLFLSLSLVLMYAWYQYAFAFDMLKSFIRDNPRYQVDSFEFTRRLDSNVIFSTFLYPPTLAGYLNIMFFTIAGVCFSKKDFFRFGKKNIFRNIFFIFLLLGCVLGLILTKSKGGWIAFLGAGILFVILEKRNAKLFLFLTAAVFCLFFILVKLSGKIYLPPISNFLDSFSVRIEYWKAALAMIKTNPLAGFGPGSFASVYPLFKTLIAEETVMAHNSFLQIWAESGILSFFSFCLFVFFLIKYALELLSKALSTRACGIIAAFSAFLIQNIVDFSLFISQVSVIMFSLLGLLFLQFRCIKLAVGKQIFFQEKSRRKTIPIVLIAMLIIVVCLLLEYSAQFYNLKANNLFTEKKYESALLNSRISAKLNPLCAHYSFFQSRILEIMSWDEKENDFKRNYFLTESITQCQIAIKQDSYMPFYHYQLGKLLMMHSKKNDYEKC